MKKTYILLLIFIFSSIFNNTLIAQETLNIGDRITKNLAYARVTAPSSYTFTAATDMDMIINILNPFVDMGTGKCIYLNTYSETSQKYISSIAICASGENMIMLFPKTISQDTYRLELSRSPELIEASPISLLWDVELPPIEANSASVTVEIITSEPTGTPIRPEPPTPNASLSASKNYVRTKTYTSESGKVYIDQIQYFDGLGRPEQVVQRKITPQGNDLVSLQTYDAFGREAESWLPGLSTGNGAYAEPADVKRSAQSAAMNNDIKPYSKPVYEQSPLNRVLAQYGPGASWQDNGKAVKYIYATNIGGSQPASTVELNNSDEPSGVVTACDRITLKPGFQFAATAEKSMTLAIDPSQCSQASVQSLAATSAEQIDPALLTCNYYKVANNQLSRSGSYQGGQLYVTQVSDEDGNKSLEFKDKLGQVVLTRQVNGSEKYDTYYVYDDFGNLCYVLPPLAVDKGVDLSDNSDVMKQYAYLYQYDDRNRCIRKRLPGTEWISYVYDKADRLIFTQDGEQANKSPKEWTFNKYDAFGRLVISGIYRSVETQVQLAEKYKNTVFKEETGKGGNYGYTWNTLSDVPINDVLLINYYDDYETMLRTNSYYKTNLDYNTEAGYGARYPNAKGLLVGTRIKVINSDGTSTNSITGQIATAMYYDSRGRLIQTKSNNHLSGGIEKEYIAYNFTGQPTQRKHIHMATGKTTQTEVYSYSYDHAGRLIETKHKLNNNAEVVLAENEYDELGRLKTNKKNNQANLNTTYTYTVRSWTKSIASPLFNQTLFYNESYGGSAKRYNGNISAMSWKLSTESITRGYAFTYDDLSQLTVAQYLQNGAANTNYKTSYTYDKHGNMKTLQRYGKTTSTAYGLIDNVTLTYTGNQLTKADDAVATISLDESNDFKNYINTATEYTYNKNGAMTKDLNRGINEIKYNSLNLPQQMDIKSPVGEARNMYVYSASGQKLRVTSTWNPNYSSSPVIGSAINTSSLTQQKVTDYVGNKIYEQQNLKRILIEGGYIENNQYHFYLTDHLGNNRVVANATGGVIQKNHYYPFGMPYAETSKAEQLKQPYKFGDKELDQMHGLNHYDFSARYMDGIRFTSVDPLAEKKPWLTPYHYCSNNPINRIDPDGRYDGFPVPNTTYWQQAAVNYKQQEYIKENAPEIQRNAAAYTASLTDANDVVVLSTTITRGSDAINIDGTPASTLDKVAAAGGVFLPVVSGSLVAKGLKKLGKLFGFSLDATTSTAKGGRFISDTDGKIIDTKTTPKGSYTHPDGSRTDVLQDKSHFDKKTQTNTGTSHTHEPPQTNTNPTTGQTYTKKSENTHRPTYEEIKNIENGTAVKTK